MSHGDYYEDPSRIPPSVPLLRALADLEWLEREVWVDRYMLGRTLQSIADEFATRDPADAPGSRTEWPKTRERIRQIEKNACRKLAFRLRNDDSLHAELDDDQLSERIRSGASGV